MPNNSGKQLEYLIDEIRENTENENFAGEIGISEEEIIRHINDAIYRLHEKIIQQHPGVFIEEEVQNVTSGTDTYTVKDTAFLDNRIALVEYSHDGTDDNYVALEQASIRQRYPGVSGHPDFYIRQSSKIILSPVPTTNAAKLRISFTRRPKRMDKRRGDVKAVTLDSGTSTITSLEVNYVNGNLVDSGELSKYSYFCVVDKYGELKMDDVKLSSIDGSASYDATITPDSSHTYESGETIAVGDYVIAGRYGTTHFQFPESVERYVRAYAEWKILKRDSSMDSQEAFAELAEMERGIVASYAELTDDIRLIPDINNDVDWY
jgi:hypothetical protein